MATRLKNILNFVCTPGTPVTHPHGLTVQSGRPVVPDCIELDATGFEVTADDTNVTVVGDGIVNVLVESWHTIERVFGDKDTLALIPQPFIVGGGGGVPTPPFVVGAVTIYARTTGSDTTGKGTLAKPYRTMQRAVRDVPNIIPPGLFYFVDITGLDETLPAGYTLPVWKSSTVIDFYGAFDQGNAFFLFQAGVNIVADPQPVAAIPLADTTVTAGDVASTTADPITGLLTITLHVARASWTNANIKGKQVVTAGGGVNNSTIASATTTTIVLNAHVAPTLPLQITEPGATLHVTTGAEASAAGLNANGIDSIAFSGLKIVTTDGQVGLSAVGDGLTICQMCELENPDIESVTQGINRIVRCWVYGFFSFGQNFAIVNSLCTAGSGAIFGVAPSQFTIHDATIDGCDPIETLSFLPGVPTLPSIASLMTLQRVAIKNGNGDGLIFHGGVGNLLNVDIAGCAGNGITVQGGTGLLNLVDVGSSVANAGSFGILVNDGMQVIVDAATSGNATPLTGSLVTQVQVGTLAPTDWTTVAAPPNNVPDYTGVDATGSRLSQK